MSTNLVPRSLVDKAEDEIWQSKKICFSWLAAPFDSCPIPTLTRFSAANFLQTQVLPGNFSGWWKWKADKKRREEERFGSNLPFGIELNNFCNMIVPLPKSQTRHPARTQAPISHTCFFWHKTLQTPPLFAFFCAYEVAQSTHENSMWGSNTRSVSARFGDNNWEKGEDFVKTFYVKKLEWEMEGSLSARALDDV